MENKKICKCCGKQFLKENIRNCNWSQKKYCSDECKYNEKYKRNRKKLIERALQRYRSNRDKILQEQSKRVKRRYWNDEDFKKKYIFRRKTARKISLDKEKCKVCRSEEDLQRHHLDYINLMNVEILCRRCHNIQHHLQRG